MKKFSFDIPATLCVAGMMLATQVAALDAPPATAPVTYIRIRKSESFDHMAVSLYRAGPRELIEMTRAADAAHPTGWRSRMWLDFTTHRQYADDSNAPGQCSVIKYTSDGPPPLLDGIGGAFGMAADIATHIPAGAKPSGTETLGIFHTSIFKPDPGTTFWVDETRHLVIKARVTMQGSSTPQTILDLSGLTFDKPDTSLLTPPKNCKRIAGESSANGGHAEAAVSPGN